MNELLDTTLNIVAFAFIGLMAWLYFFGPVVDPDTDKADDDDDHRPA